MTSRNFRYVGLVGLLVTSSSFVSMVGAAEPPTVAQTMAIHPQQKDVEYETPKESEFAKCKIEVEKKGKTIGWVVLGPNGQILRKFLDTDGDGKYDQYRYYNLGVEVYRDIDTNQNQKIDQFRWLNRGGSRWGIDKNEDGRIDQWKVLSAAEASREAIRAVVAGDAIALQAVLITADDMKSLGINAQLAAKLLESAADSDKKAKAVMKNSKVMTPQSVWSRFDAQLPSVIPIDEEKAKEDLQVYESAYAIIETPRKGAEPKSDAVQLGEMIRVGDVWKLIQVPMPIEGTATTNPILMEPLLASSSIEGSASTTSPKVAQALKELQEIDDKLLHPNPNLQPAQMKNLVARRAALFKEATVLAETDEEKESLMRQNVDVLALVAQIGNYPEGIKELRTIEAEISKKSSNSSLLPYTIYRRIQAQYSVDLKENAGDKEKQADIQKVYFQSLEEFVSKYPDSSDTDEAIMNLGIQEELQGQSKEALAWYQKLVKEKPKSNQFVRAQGALKRLNLKDQSLAIDGPLLTGGNLTLKKGKVYLVVFWNSAYEACENDIPQLRALYRDFNPKGFEIVGVALETDKSVVQEYVKKHEMTWPQVFQPGQQNQFGGIDSPIAVNFGIFSFPTMFLVNAEGKVVSRNANLTEIKSDLPGLLNPKKK